MASGREVEAGLEPLLAPWLGAFARPRRLRTAARKEEMFAGDTPEDLDEECSAQFARLSFNSRQLMGLPAEGDASAACADRTARSCACAAVQVVFFEQDTSSGTTRSKPGCPGRRGPKEGGQTPLLPLAAATPETYPQAVHDAMPNTTHLSEQTWP